MLGLCCWDSQSKAMAPVGALKLTWYYSRTWSSTLVHIYGSSLMLIVSRCSSAISNRPRHGGLAAPGRQYRIQCSCMDRQIPPAALDPVLPPIRRMGLAAKFTERRSSNLCRAKSGRLLLRNSMTATGQFNAATQRVQHPQLLLLSTKHFDTETVPK